jgi:hypothetical protein
MRHTRPMRFKPLLPFLLLLILLALPRTAEAVDTCDNAPDPIAISTDCYDLVIGSAKTDVSVGPSATVSPFFSPYDAVLVRSSGEVTGTFLNQGTISSGFGRNGLVNEGRITTLVNDVQGIMKDDGLSAYEASLINSGEIGTLVNKGKIEASIGSWGSGAHAILQAGHIGTLDNSGIITAQNSAIYFALVGAPRIDTLINSNLIQGGVNGSGTSTFASTIKLNPGSSIGTIINTGIIDHSVCDAGGTCFAAIENDGGSIGTITNLGKLTSGNTGNSGYGIINGITSTIGTLNNDQNDLKYFGKLPQNYMAIVYGPTDYGKMAVTNASGTMNFGVDAAAPLGESTYAAVLSGVTSANLKNILSGEWGGGLFNNTWELEEDTNLASVWDLKLTSEAIVPSVEGESGQSLAEAILKKTTELASGSVPPGTIEPVLENGVTLQQAAQTMTAEQASQLSDVHAEGYSSNLTIGLQQIAMISEAVTDRIDDEDEPSRRIWVDGSAIRGTVDGYDGLSGFDYNLFHVILGGDIISSSTGNFGVYAGLGQSSMAESEYVPQDFSTTSLFAGLYGGRDFAAGVRLAASAGYIHGANEATRHNADIGQFTGGDATSDYATDGVHGTVKLSKAIDVSDGLTLSPFAGAALAQLWAERAEETGGGDFNYTISDAAAYTTVVFVGSGVRAPVSGSMAVVGFARLGYDMFADDDDAHSVTATSHLFGSFEQVGADMGAVLANMGLGIEGQSAHGVSGRIGAVGALNSNGFEVGLGGEVQW